MIFLIRLKSLYRIHKNKLFSLGYITILENIIGTLLTNKQLSDLQDLLSDSANIGIEEDTKDTGTFFEDEDPF